MILYHASEIEGITELRPNVANHKNEYVYLSERRKTTCVYLVNPIRKFCLENNIICDRYDRFAVSGWDQEKHCPCLYEWWPNAFNEIYKGTRAFFYCVEKTDDLIPLEELDPKFKNSRYWVSSKPVQVDHVQEIPDVLEFLQEMEKEGKISLIKNENLNEQQRQLIIDISINSYKGACRCNRKATMAFYEAKFDFIRNLEMTK